MFSVDIDLKIDFYEMITKLKSGDLTLNGIRGKMNKACKKVILSEDTNRKIVKYYNRHGFYGADFLRYFLCEYEVSLSMWNDT